MHLFDTIAALATPPGQGGIAIVRISGPASYPIADRLFRAPGPRPSERPAFTFAHGHVAVGDDHLDECLLLFMRAPRSFTGEDVVEVHCHGGPVVAGRVLRAILHAGARSAEPGEFTRRAFLHGRLDLVQAEAVLDLIRARSDRAATAALEQLEGVLSHRLDRVYEGLLEVAADLEATLDFPDDELPGDVLEEIFARLSATREALQGLLDTWTEGHLLREGVRVVITGSPNAGKSTLLNAMLGRDRAIVSESPGTTRDTIEEGLVIQGVPVRLIDTAGLRASDCAIEAEGMRRTRQSMQLSDIQILMIDSSGAMEDEDEAMIRALEPKRSIIVLNKTDLGVRIDVARFPGMRVVETSLLGDGGAEPVRAALADLLGSNQQLAAPAHAVISERHRELLLAADSRVAEAETLSSREGESGHLLAASALRQALEHLGEITGRVYHDDLLDRIFSRFCIGK